MLEILQFPMLKVWSKPKIGRKLILTNPSWWSTSVLNSRLPPPPLRMTNKVSKITNHRSQITITNHRSQQEIIEKRRSRHALLPAPRSQITSSQAPSYASPKLRLTHSLTGVKCRATSVAKNHWGTAALPSGWPTKYSKITNHKSQTRKHWKEEQQPSPSSPLPSHK